MIHASLFTGIGGFDLAAEMLDWPTAFQCEINPFARAVLMHRFGAIAFETLAAAEFADIVRQWRAWRPGQPKPPTVLYADIKEVDARVWRSIVAIISGGFPCQPFSSAGKGLGNDDPRALWPQYRRIIQEVQPGFVVAENVRGLLDKFPLAFEAVCTDLEAEDYDVQPFLLPACSIGAPHRRDRFWFVAHARRTDGAPQDHQRREPEPEYGQEVRPDAQASGTTLSDAHGLGWQANQQDLRWRESDLAGGSAAGRRWLTEPALCRSDDGLPPELVRPANYEEQLTAYGNAIVPQLACQIFKALQAND